MKLLAGIFGFLFLYIPIANADHFIEATYGCLELDDLYAVTSVYDGTMDSIKVLPADQYDSCWAATQGTPIWFVNILDEVQTKNGVTLVLYKGVFQDGSTTYFAVSETWEKAIEFLKQRGLYEEDPDA